MISPDFRNYKPGNLPGTLKSFIEKNHGSDVAVTLGPQIDQLQEVRKELVHAN